MLEKIFEYLATCKYFDNEGNWKTMGIPNSFKMQDMAKDITEICEKEDAYWKQEFIRVANNYEKIWIENSELKKQLEEIKSLRTNTDLGMIWDMLENIAKKYCRRNQGVI